MLGHLTKQEASESISVTSSFLHISLSSYFPVPLFCKLSNNKKKP